MRVKHTRFVRSVGCLHCTRPEGRHKNATPKTANRPVFCFVSTQCLVYYFLLFLDPNLTISYLATLAGLRVALNGLLCADVPFRTYSLTQSLLRDMSNLHLMDV